MGENKGAGLRLRYLGYRLRQLREQCGLPLDHVAQAQDTSASELSRLERGLRAWPREDLAALLSWYGMPRGEIRQVLVHLRPRNEGWFGGVDQIHKLHEALADVSGDLVGLQDYAPLTVPVLLHTSAYTTVLARVADPCLSAAELARRVAPHLVLQQRVLQRGVDYRAVIDETALRREHLDTELWARQLHRLAYLADRPNVSIGVLPATTTVVPQQFTILTFDDGAEVVYTGGPVTAALSDTREDIAVHRRVFRSFDGAALSETKSLELLRALAEESPIKG